MLQCSSTWSLHILRPTLAGSCKTPCCSYLLVPSYQIFVSTSNISTMMSANKCHTQWKCEHITHCNTHRLSRSELGNAGTTKNTYWLRKSTRATNSENDANVLLGDPQKLIPTRLNVVDHSAEKGQLSPPHCSVSYGLWCTKMMMMMMMIDGWVNLRGTEHINSGPLVYLYRHTGTGWGQKGLVKTHPVTSHDDNDHHHNHWWWWWSSS